MTNHRDTSKQHFQAVRQLFEEVAELPETEQIRALDRASADAPEVVARVREMLALGGQDSERLLDEITALTRMANGEELPSLADDEGLLAAPTVRGCKVLDPYVAYRFVGKGGFGRVYRGFHMRLGTEVAIKCMAEDFKVHPEGFARFEREARLGASQKSRHLIQVLDCNQRFGLLYLVMEWVDGEDLGNRIARLGARPWQEVVTLLFGIATGIAEIHRNAIVHRDIKPANAMLTREGIVKVADLGLARHTLDTKMQMSGHGVGTPAYMAPEQWDSLHEAGAPADVFSLGATAWHLLVGSTPPRQRGEALRQRLATAADAPPELLDLILHCLEERPEDRPEDAAALLAPLEQLLQAHDLPRELPADQVLLPLDDDAPTLDATARSGIRDEWSTAQTKPEQQHAETAGQQRTAAATSTRPLPPPGPEPRRQLAVWLLVAAVVVAAIWIGARVLSPSDPDGRADGERSAARAPAGDAAADQGRGDDGEPSGDERTASEIARKDEAGASPSSASSASTSGVEPLVANAILIDGQRLDIRDEVRFARGRRKFSEDLERASITFVWNRAPQEDELIRMGDRQLKASDALSMPIGFGSNAVEFEVGGKSFRLLIEQPCRPTFMTGHEPRRGDGRTPAFLPLPLPLPETDIELRFVWATDDFMVCATEVSRREWVAFLQAEDGEAFARELAGDEVYAAWLDGLPIRRRVELELQDLTDDGRATKRDHPIGDRHVSEAAAYARWLSRQLDGVIVRLPTAAEWRQLANANAGRALDARGGLPFRDDDKAVCLPNRSSQPKEFEQFARAANAESIWSFAHGELGIYHLGGNLAEMCIDATDGVSPVAGCHRGGSHSDELRMTRVPERDDYGTWKDGKAPEADDLIGFRLILTTPK